MKLDTRFPHPGPRIPIIGDVFGADRHRPTQHEMVLTEQLGPIFERKLLDVHLTIVTGATLAVDCNDEQRWARALAGPTMKFRGITGSGLFTARTSDPLWGKARRILDPGFAQSALRTYHQAMSSVADDMLASWPDHGQVDIHQAMTNATLEVIARAGFSRNLGLFSDTADPQVTDLIDTLNKVLSWASESSNDIPGIGHVRGAIQRRRLDGGLRRARQYVDQIVADRADGTEASNNNDLLALMLAATDPETGEGLPHDNIRDQVLTFLVAGHETTAALLETTLWYLARRPELAAQIRAEAAERGFGYDGVAGMRVTRRVLNEALRLWPPVPGYFRVSRVDQQLGGYDIPAGHSVFVHVLAAQRDRQVWGEAADEFDPDRWESKALRQYPDRFFVPFGTGPRSCIGRAFAMQEAALLISRLVSAYDFTLDAPATATAPDMLERGTLRPTPYQCTVTAVSP